MTPTVLAIYWGMKLLAALGAVLFGAAKWIDWRRHKNVPVQLTSRAYRSASPEGVVFSAERPAPVMAGCKTEHVARFADIAEYIKTGDPLLFSGRSIWSYILRIGTFSDKSHVGIAVRDDEGVWVVDSCEGRNVTKRLLFDEIKRFPGQWYHGSIRHEFNHNYHRERAAEAAMAMVANKTLYGWAGIAFQAIIRCPVLRELAYIFHIDRLPFYENRPFCSQALKRWMKVGSLDPVPRRDEQLVTPQDINQSLAIHQLVAIVP